MRPRPARRCCSVSAYSLRSPLCRAPATTSVPRRQLPRPLPPPCRPRPIPPAGSRRRTRRAAQGAASLRSAHRLRTFREIGQQTGLRPGRASSHVRLEQDNSPGAPPEGGEGGLVFSAASIPQIEKTFADAEALSRSHFSVAAILIDPGHGGKDPGAIGELTAAGKKLRVVEKDITLAVSLKLYAALKAKYPDKRILVTRDDDSYPSLEDRVELANSVELEAERGYHLRLDTRQFLVQQERQRLRDLVPQPRIPPHACRLQ